MSADSRTASSSLVAWRRVKLGDISSKPQYGWTTKARTDGYGVKLLRTTDITAGEIDWAQVPFCTDLPPDVEKYLVHEGDILISRAGSVGVSHLVTSTEPSVFASYLIRFKPGPEVLPKYLAYFLRSPSYWKQIADNTAGIAVPNVNASKLQEIYLLLASLQEQRRIVAEIEKQFSRLDEAVANLKRVKANLKRYAAATIRDAVTGRLVETEAEIARSTKSSYEPGSELLDRILLARQREWSGRGKCPNPTEPDRGGLAILPEGWAWASADQLSDFITKGTTPPAVRLSEGSGEVQFLKVYNLTFDGKLNHYYKPAFISRDTHENALARSKVRPGDVLINIVGPPLGQVSIVPNDLHEANINQAIARVRPVGPLDARFLAIALRSDEIMGWAIQRAKTTAGQSNLTLELCRALPVPLPPLAEQRRIVAEVDRSLSVISDTEAEVDANLKRAEALRQSILHRAFAHAQ